LCPLISFTDRFGYLEKNSCDVVLVDEAHRLDGAAVTDLMDVNYFCRLVPTILARGGQVHGSCLG
jgi:hypothetical protein